MIVSAVGNLLNIAGNAVFMFVFHWGVFGAAFSTMLSRRSSALRFCGSTIGPDR